MSRNRWLRIRLGLMVAAILLSSQLAKATEPAANGAYSQVDAAVKSPDLGQVAGLLIEGTNRFRKQQGRSELQSQADLVATARDFAEVLARVDKLSHEADGSDPQERAKQHGYVPCVVAENIA